MAHQQNGAPCLYLEQERQADWWNTRSKTQSNVIKTCHVYNLCYIKDEGKKKEERGFSDRSLPWVMGVVRNEHDSVKLEQAPRWLSSDATTINRVSSWRGLDHAEPMLGSLAPRRSIPADAPVTITQGRARCQSLNVRAAHGAAALVRHCHSRCTDKPRRAMSPLSLPSAV